MAIKDVDVLVIGGGPAGLATAIVCANQGLHTLVCEKEQFPVDKACGEGILPPGVQMLKRLDISKHLENDQVSLFAGIRYILSDGICATGRFNEGPGWGVRRIWLSQALKERAAQITDVELKERVSAQPIERNQSGIIVMAGDELIRTRLLVGADGLNSTVRLWAGLEGSYSKGSRWGARQHFSIAPWSNYVEVHWSQGVEAYITPCSSDMVNAAVLWDRRIIPRVKGGSQVVRSLLDHFPTLKERLNRVETTDQPAAIGPMQRRATGLAAEGILLIGDAAGYVDAITGEGISLALAQVSVFESTVIPHLKRGRRSRTMLTAQHLNEYARRSKKLFQHYQRFTGFILALSQNIDLARRVIIALDRNPVLFRHLLSVNMGQASFWPGFKHSLNFLKDFV